jgi:hypothetical protein
VPADQYTGRVYIYRRNEKRLEWDLEATLLSPLGIAMGYGYTVSICGDRVVVGTAVNDAFIYQRDAFSNEWALQTALTCPDGVAGPSGIGPYFGRAVSISGDYVVVGAHGARKYFVRTAVAIYGWLRCVFSRV